MKLLAAVLAAGVLAPGIASAHHARARHAPTAHHPRSAAVRVHEANPPSLAEGSDEIELSPSLMKELKTNLAAAGYFDGPIDGRLTHRTRRALADFQRDYHMAPTGALDYATAEALLGHDTLSAYLVARK